MDFGKRLTYSIKFIVLMLTFSSCGYQFQGSGSILPDDIKTVAIPVAENNTTESGIGLQFTEILRSRFERYGVVKVVEKDSQADAILKVKIVSIENRVSNVTSKTDIELGSQLVLTVAAELRRRNGQVLWKNPQLVTTDSFASVGDVVVTSGSDFSQGGISRGTLSSLGSREVSRSQQSQAVADLLDEASRVLYLDAVAEDF